MNSPDWVKGLWEQIIWFAGLGRHCVEDAGRFDECVTFWAGVGAVAGIICVMGLYLIARHFLRERAAYRRAWEKRQAEMAVAPPEVIAQAKWTGDAAMGADMTQEEMVRRIKEAKTQKKFAGLSTPDNQNTEGKVS
jgi:hypothetical protein